MKTEIKGMIREALMIKDIISGIKVITTIQRIKTIINPIIITRTDIKMMKEINIGRIKAIIMQAIITLDMTEVINITRIKITKVKKVVIMGTIKVPNKIYLKKTEN